MESWENKIIADKLNSLQEFPAGYTPDLSSKWEIVAAGLPAKKKRRIPVLVQWSAAAAVVVSILFIGVNTGSKEKTDYAITPAKKSVPVNDGSLQKEAVPAAEVALEKVAEYHPENNAAATVPNKTEHDASGPKDKKTAPETIPEAALTAKYNAPQNDLQHPITFQGEDTAGSSTINDVALLLLPEKAKPAKRKVYQRDFNDGVLAIDTGFSKTNTQHFSIKLLPFSRKTKEGEEHPLRHLQVKQVL